MGGRKPIETSDGPCPLGQYIQDQLARHPGVQEKVFAEVIGITRSSFSKLKQGLICAPSPRVIEGIASAFNVSVEEVEVYRTTKQIGISGETRTLPDLLGELDAIRQDLFTTTARLEQVMREIALQLQSRELTNFPSTNISDRADQI